MTFNQRFQAEGHKVLSDAETLFEEANNEGVTGHGVVLACVASALLWSAPALAFARALNRT